MHAERIEADSSTHNGRDTTRPQTMRTETWPGDGPSSFLAPMALAFRCSCSPRSCSDSGANPSSCPQPATEDPSCDSLHQHHHQPLTSLETQRTKTSTCMRQHAAPTFRRTLTQVRGHVLSAVAATNVFTNSRSSARNTLAINSTISCVESKQAITTRAHLFTLLCTYVPRHEGAAMSSACAPIPAI